jgi:SAM-dependent methyltransferase
LSIGEVGELEDLARVSYDRFSRIYDEWNARNDYEMWVGEVLLQEMEKHGLQRGWALDVGCGTGRAFEPLLARGWQVLGCDVSAGMLTQARRKFESRVRLIEADARDLPLISPAPGIPPGEAFQLILLLNDVVNYVTKIDELERIFAGIKGNLGRDRELVAFDANALRLYREDYLLGVEDVRGAQGWKWCGLTDEIKSAGIFEARLSGRDCEPHVHRQRHWMLEQVEDALEAAGLRALAVLGQREEAGRVLLASSPDEERDRKVLYIAGHST